MMYSTQTTYPMVHRAVNFVNSRRCKRARITETAEGLVFPSGLILLKGHVLYVIEVTNAARLPGWARTLDGQLDALAILRRVTRSGACPIDRETMEVVRGLALHTLGDWYAEQEPTAADALM